MRNWKLDGWVENDWNSISGDAERMWSIAWELGDAVGCGCGSFEPKELIEFSKRMQMSADRLKQIAGGYV